MYTTKDDVPFGLIRLGFSSEEERSEYEKDKIARNKAISRVTSAAAHNAKRDYCMLCQKKCTSFCNSHSVPQFALYRIATEGKVVSPLQGEVPSLGKDFGVRKAGAFHLICNECDSTVFQQYENPAAYTSLPSDQMLAQIATKNLLHMISKRNEERELYTLLGFQHPNSKDYADEKVNIGDYDLRDYHEGLKYAQKALKKGGKKAYYLCYFKVLDYVVPYAAQASIDMLSDFEDNVINDIYRFEQAYRLKDIHVAVFPLEKTSVVLMFIEDGDKRYRGFYRQLHKLSDEDQLAAINYIIFAYTENVFMHPDTCRQMRENPRFMDVCQKTTDYQIMFPFLNVDPLIPAIEEFSLSRRKEIPNLLSREYAIDT